MRVASGLLWIAAAAFLLIGGFLLLFACDFSAPSLFALSRNYCPVPAARSPLDGERARQRELESKIHEAELVLAATPGCAPPPPPPPIRAELPEPEPPRAEAPKPETPKPETPPRPQVAEAPKPPPVGARGKLEVTLRWSTSDDLDLQIDCPGGRISPINARTKGPGVCGDGVHDVDANRNRIHPVTNPAEHIRWNSDIPDGQYRVLVHPHMTGGPAPIRYEVTVKLDDEEKVCRGVVMWDSKNHRGYEQYAIDFAPTHPLPDCSYKDVPLRPCPNGSCKP